MATKFNINQANNPAPLWYRRFSNAMVALVIPAATALVEGWGLSDIAENRVLHLLIFLAALIKGVGVFLGNGQTYANKVIAVVLAAFTLAACSSPRKAAQKEQAYIQQLQNRYNTDTAAPVILQVPGGIVRLTDTTPCPDFVNTEMRSDSGRITLLKPCPPVRVNADSIVRASTLYKAAILGRRDAEISAALEKESRLRTEGVIERLEKSGRIGWGIAIFLGVAGVVAFKFFK